MAHNVEPMDIDNIESDFDNKENSIHHNNVYPRTPCTEKGYEELDVSELNMKLRYSVTPASSPMSKSYTANCVDNKNQESSDDHLNSNLTRSFNAVSSRGDVNKSLKSLPLQPITADHFQDNNRNASVLRDTTVDADTRNLTITVKDEKYETFGLPSSSSSSSAQTPEVTTPTKEMPRIDGGSPIMRGLKTVLNMFRSSQSPIPLTDSGDSAVKQMLSPADATPEFDSSLQPTQSVLASTPIAAYKNKESTSRRNSPHKDSIVFNEDLEKELLWKDETTILFSQEKIPLHKLFYQQPLPNNAGPTKSSEGELANLDDNLNSTVEYMDISYNDSIIKDSITEVSINVGESDGEFVDCETTITDDKTQTTHVGGTINEATPENEKVPQEDTTHLPLLLQKTLSIANSTNVISSTSTDTVVSLQSSITKDPIDENNLVADKTTSLVTEKSETLSTKMNEENLVSNIPTLDTDLNIMTDNKEMLLPTDTDKIVLGEQIVLSKSSHEVTGHSLINPNASVGNNTIEDCSLLPQSVPDSFVVPKQTDSTEVSYSNTSDKDFNSITSEYHSIVSKEINRPVNSKNKLIEQTVQTENVVSPALTTKAENNSKFVIELNDPFISVHKPDNDLPVNVPLPDEDDFDTVKPIISTNTCPDFNSINNYTIDTKLQSAQHNIVNVPIETIDQAKSLIVCNTNNSNKDVDVASMATNMIQDHQRNSEKSSIFDKKMNNVIALAQNIKPDHNLTLDIITDIDNIISDAYIFVNDQQYKLVSNSLYQKLDDSFETKKNKDNIEQSLTGTQCQNPENQQDVAGVDLLQQQSQVLSIDIDNMSKLEQQHADKFNEVVEHYSQPICNDNKLDSFQPDFNKLNSEQSLKSMECQQKPENQQNKDGVDALQQQSQVLNIDIDNMSKLELQHAEKCNEVVEKYSQPLCDDNKLNSFQPDFNKLNSEQSLKSMECQQKPENQQNKDGVDALQQQSQVLNIDIDNMSKLELQHAEKCNEVVEKYSQPLCDDNKLNSFQPDFNKLNSEQSLKSMECQQNPNNQQNKDGVDALQKQPQVVSINIGNMSKLELQHAEKCNEVVEHYSQPLCDDNKLDSFQPDFKKLNSEQSLKSMECQQNPNNQQNKDGVDALQQQPQVVSIDIDNISKLELQHAENCNEVVEHYSQSLCNDNKLDSFQTDFNKPTTEQSLTSKECQPLDNQQNEAYPNLLQIESKVRCEEISNEYMQHDGKCNDVVEHNLQPLSKYNMSVDNISVEKEIKFDIDIMPVEDALTNFTTATPADNDISPLKRNVFEINSKTKLELLSDVYKLPPIETPDAPDEISVDNVINNLKVTGEKNQINNFQDIVSVEKTNEKPIINKDEIEDNIDEEIILSENNSPYVSIAGDINPIEKQPMALENVENPFVTNVAISPPISPKIVSKGYNFNFDEIDDPFATKTKIRLSPPLDSPKGNFIDPVEDKYPQRKINKNRRKSQLNRKQSVVPKKAINKTFSGPVNVVEQEYEKLFNTNKHQSSHTISKSETNVTRESILCPGVESEVLEKPVVDPVSSSVTVTLGTEIDAQNESTEDLHDSIAKYTPDHNATVSIDNEVFASDDVALIDENKMSFESLINSNEVKQTSSSDRSAYYSAATSSAESINNINVFNIPEIEDTNFNPFITKCRVRQSPPPGKDDSFNLNFKKLSEANKTSDAYEDKECANVSNITCSSKATDEKDITVREVHTEDEDTVEGPFLEIEDLNNVDKISDFDGEDVDMMQFSELPVQSNDENFEDGEMFIDADAFEFLLNQNKTNVVADSGKESLFLKFDPLFAKRVSTDGVLAALKNVQKRQSTPKKTSVAQQVDITFKKPIDGPSTLNVVVAAETNTDVTVEDSTEELNVTVSKPMMVVTPAVNSVVTPRNKTTTPTSSNRRSITFTSPAIAVIDRLLSLSSNNNSLLGHDTTITQVSREQNEADLALTQLRELLAEKEINVYNLRSESKDLKNRLTSLESQMRTLESESEERLKKLNELNEKLSEKTKLNKSMAAVVEEYERTIASLIAETEQDKKRNNEERIKLIKERDEQTAHLASMEVSFSDLHSKYEKSKQIILSCKANEDAYKKSIKEFEDNLSKMQSNYELLKQHATSKLNYANQELEKMNRAHEAEVLKLNAMIKRKELHITSLEETLAQKTKANEELTAICDELINKVG